MDTFYQDQQNQYRVKEIPITDQFDNICKRLKSRLTDKNFDKNAVAQTLRIFNTDDDQQLGFPNLEQFRERYSDTICACYIFRFKNSFKSHTHGLYVRIADNKAVPRKTMESFIKKLVFLMCGKQYELKSVTHQMSRNISLYDYLQQLYVLPKNLLVNYSHYQDLVTADSPDVNINHNTVQEIINVARRYTSTILENTIGMPSLYVNSSLYRLLQLEPKDYVQFMRWNTMSKFCYQMCQDAYNYALQVPELQGQKQLLDPQVRRSLVTKFTNENIIKNIQTQVQHTFNTTYVHPHPLVNVMDSDLLSQDVFDLMVLDARFIFPLLLCSRWFSKVCMRRDDVIQNNQAHLLLYGQSGTGKSLIMGGIFGSNVPTYRFMPVGRFQNPDILSSSVFIIDEFNTNELVSNSYKSLLDIKASVKVDLKNIHPENVSENVPCMISTNDDIYTNLKNLTIRNNIHQNSVDAAIRRLYIVPLKFGQFDSIHRPIGPQSPHYQEYAKYNQCWENEQNKLSRLFNFVVAFGLYQNDIDNMLMNGKLFEYYRHLPFVFEKTLFGQFYLQFKDKVDKLILSVESMMKTPDINDTEYQSHCAMQINKLGCLMKKYIKKIVPQNNGQNCANILKQIDIPWHLKIYKLFDQEQFVDVCQQQFQLQHCNLMNREIFEWIQHLPNQIGITCQNEDNNNLTTTQQDVMQKRLDDMCQQQQATNEQAMQLDEGESIDQLLNECFMQHDQFQEHNSNIGLFGQPFHPQNPFPSSQDTFNF